MRIKVRDIINKGLSRTGYQLERCRPNPIHLWDQHAEFSEQMSKVSSYTLVDKARCFMLFQFARQASRIAGDIAEVGVYKGGTARLLAKTLEPTGKNIHLFDTFTGMPSVDQSKDLHREGDFHDTSLEAVKSLLSDCRNVHFHAGWFPHSAKPVEALTFCFVHIDVDIYRSVIDCCNFFYPRLQGGGIMVFDDYGFRSCPGARLAVDEFFSDKVETPCYLPTGQCYVTRLLSDK
ncbi:MAG: TylF/MycF family methyltransferase [Acidobacteriia bacterium]|nr:TylF/MycF family methyltransferase [Terriglobia bacterium]